MRRARPKIGLMTAYDRDRDRARRQGRVQHRNHQFRRPAGAAADLRSDPASGLEVELPLMAAIAEMSGGAKERLKELSEKRVVRRSAPPS